MTIQCIKFFARLCTVALPREGHEEVREIAFKIGLLERYGLDINDPQESHVLRALPRRVFSALQLISSGSDNIR
jgi:hypothetical protein